MVDAVKDRQVREGSLKQGFRALKIKVGRPELFADRGVVSEVQQITGPDTALMIEYNQSLQLVEAIRRLAGRTRDFADTKSSERRVRRLFQKRHAAISVDCQPGQCACNAVPWAENPKDYADLDYE